ncbi:MULTISPECIES: hypothetical protein [Methylotenera]|uniref:hypothetical protein n=1 Tax=Methylotenera TaxID=359407 RepID=UPI00036CA03F|nr:MULTISPECIES: hypothetical protein [Methylotenera]
MFKKMMAFMLLSMISAVSTTVLADINSVAKIGGNVKMNDAAPVIRLAVNDVAQLQGVDDTNMGVRNVSEKNSASDKSTVELSTFELNKLPPQAWLILGALFCFVMRSSRRSV